MVSIFIKLLLEWRAESQTDASGFGHGNNTQARNKALTTLGHFVLCGSLSLLTAIPFIARRFLQVEITMNIFFACECFFHLTTALVMPLVIYLSSEDMRHYFKRAFWDNAPELLQMYNPDRVIEINI
jgi:hypothetical protein